jgi:hypothetical protein
MAYMAYYFSPYWPFKKFPLPPAANRPAWSRAFIVSSLSLK